MMGATISYEGVLFVAFRGDRLRALREDRDISLAEVGRAIGLTAAAISAHELGKRQPDLATITRLAEFYRVSVDYLLGRTDDPTPPGQKQPAITEEQVEAFLRGKGLTEEDWELIKLIEERRAREREKRGPRPKPDHPF